MDEGKTGTADPICTVCSQPVTDDSERAVVRAPGSGASFEDAQVLYHHQSCEREGRLFLTPS